MERKDKIKFLNDLQNGRINLKEVLIPITKFYVLHNGVYLDMKTGKEMIPQEAYNPNKNIQHGKEREN